MTNVKIEIDSTVNNIVTLGVLEFSQLKCQPKNFDLWIEIEKLAKKYNSQYSSTSVALNKLKPARDLYRAMGIEPTKIRPSSEALFRRAIKNKPLYQINSIVDVSNYLSLSIFLPIGLYDSDKIMGNIILRTGYENEFYKGIGKDIVHVTGRLTLTDSVGPFGNPSSDSLRTSIDLNSQNVLMILFAPNHFPETMLQQHLEYSTELMTRFHPSGLVLQNIILK